MPLSHLNLTVSHIPTSTSFFLACLQPLGYRYVGRTDNSVGFGPDPGDHADFWISEETPGVRAGAAHVAFPAPSRAAVDAFFIAALKAGGQIHGEPRLRDAEQGYFSAAVVDFDGNSVEAVHRPSSSGPAAAAAASASVKKSRSIATTREKKVAGSETAAAGGSPVVNVPRLDHSLERQTTTTTRTVSKAPSRAITSHTPGLSLSGSHHVSAKDKDETSGKTVVGTLIGAAAGAAVAYAMCKGDSQSESADARAVPASPSAPSHPSQQLSESKSIHKPSSPQAQILPSESERKPQRAIEAPPRRDGMSDYASSALSKNPRASTIFDGLDRCSKLLGGGGGGDDQPGGTQLQHYRPTGNIVSTGRIDSETNLDLTNLPIRAIEDVPSEYGYSNGKGHGNGSECSHAYSSYMHNPATPISSFADRDRDRSRDDSDAISLRSSSTIKPSKKTNKLSASSSRVSSSRGHARKVPLPATADVDASGMMTKSSTRSSNNRHCHGHGSSSTTSAARSHASFRSARDIPLPASEVTTGSGVPWSREKGRGGGSKASLSSNTQHSSKSKFGSNEPLRPSDSASQVSSSSSVAGGAMTSRKEMR